jgi:hypothetical protein
VAELAIVSEQQQELFLAPATKSGRANIEEGHLEIVAQANLSSRNKISLRSNLFLPAQLVKAFRFCS